MIARLLLAACTLAACEHDDLLAQAYGFPPGSPDASSGSTTSEVSTTTPTPTGDGPIATVTGASTGLESSSSSSGVGSSTGEPTPPPTIVGVKLPQTVTSAGPVHVEVLALHATTVIGALDEKTVVDFKSAGDEDGDGVESFVAKVPIFGTVDDGMHSLEVIAQRDGLEDRVTRPFEVATPAAGMLAWERYGGPGTRTTRLVMAPDETLLDAGGFEIGGIERPAIRKRDPLTGNDLWPGSPLVLDTREGSVADVAPTPDGRVWVAMNVREGGAWRARIALFEPDMQPAGEEIEKPGATVTAIESDGSGGYFAVGYMTTAFGDTDVVMWRVTGDGVPIASGQLWDYKPFGFDPHFFSDLAFDVAVDELTREVWIVGGSFGKHDKFNTHVRGTIFRVDLDTIGVLDPVLSTPPNGNMVQSMFHGVALDLDGVFVTGKECNHLCTLQQVTAARYGVGGLTGWIHNGEPYAASSGTSIARNAHEAVLFVANFKKAATMQGYVFGRRDGLETFPTVILPGTGMSLASSVVVGPYDWAFVGGQATVAGAPQAYVMRLHQ